MAEIFISYKSERRRAAEHVAAVLERHGYSVWFDYQLIKGRDFGLQIDRKVREAKALVALWCSMSVSSRWVAEEVDLAYDLGILVPVKIEACELPVGFRRQDYINLTEWDGAPRSHQLDPLLDALEQKVGQAPAPDAKALREYDATWRRFGALPLRAFALDQLSQDREGDRGLPGLSRQQGLDVAPRSNDQMPSFLMLAAREWPAVRDSGDRHRLLRFAQHFAGTYYAEEAHELCKAIEAADPVGRAAATTHPPPPLKPGTRFRDLDIGPEMIVVPAGEFLMGSPDNEGANDERPQHKVMIKNPIAVGVAPITWGEFAAFVDATDNKIEPGARALNGSEWKVDPSKSWRAPGFRQGDDHPVVCVNWDDAQVYIVWLRKRSGKSYRLLSEAEWEYCCRAGTTTACNMSDIITPDKANFGGNVGGTTSVSTFPRNAWGLRDMHGNVWEWCEDHWHDSYSDNPPLDGSVWREGNRSLRVLRGGSWYSDPRILRSAVRYGDQPSARVIDFGFRVARTL